VRTIVAPAIDHALASLETDANATAAPYRGPP
jgi:hypothetical protein